MSKYLLVTRGSIEVVETDAPENIIMGLKYPASFISLTIMEELEGPY